MSDKPAANIRLFTQVWHVHVTGLAICVVMTALVLMLGIAPQLAQRKVLAQKKVELAEARTKGGKLSGALTSVRTRLEQVNQRIARQPLKLTTASQVNTQLAKLTELAISAGLSVDGVSPAASMQRSEFYDAVPIHVAGTGTYHTFVGFLRELHELMPDVGVTLFDLRGVPSAATESGTELKFTLDLDWYTLPESAARSAAGR